MSSAMTLSHSNRLESKDAQRFSFLMEGIFLQQPRDSKSSFTTFGLEKAEEVSSSKAIMEESSLSFGTMTIQGSIVLRMTETCICGTFKTIRQELTSMSTIKNL